MLQPGCYIENFIKMIISSLFCVVTDWMKNASAKKNQLLFYDESFLSFFLYPTEQYFVKCLHTHTQCIVTTIVVKVTIHIAREICHETPMERNIKWNCCSLIGKSKVFLWWKENILLAIRMEKHIHNLNIMNIFAIMHTRKT